MDNLDKLISKINVNNSTKKVLFATGFSGYNHGAIVDKLIASKLLLQNVQVEFFICDKFLPGCMLTKIKQIDPEDFTKVKEQPRCDNCFNKGEKFLRYLNVKKNYFSENISTFEINQIEDTLRSIKTEDIKNFCINKLNIGEEAYAGTIRYFGKEKIFEEKYFEEILRKFFKSALITYYCFKNVLKNKYDTIVFSHGVYVPHGIINKLCQEKQIPTVIYIPSYRKNTFIFSKDDTYHKTMVNEKNEWINFEFNKKKRELIINYLDSRKKGSNDWIVFNKENNFDVNKYLDQNKKNILLLTNVMWDARLHYSSNAFESMEEWIIKTIDFYSDKEGFNLIIRVHPAEITGDVPSRQKIEDLLNNHYKVLPKNIKIIPPENPASTYELIEKSNLILIYSTKTGIEAASRGKKVVVAGEAWIRNKGFSYDATSKENYQKILEEINCEEDLSHEKKELALKYAYYIFFRRMIRLDKIKIKLKNSRTVFETKIRDYDDLKNDKILDLISDGILHNKKIEFDDENYILEKNVNLSFYQSFIRKVDKIRDKIIFRK